MPFYCDLCHAEMPENDTTGWESFFFGTICGNHNKEDVQKVIELTQARYEGYFEELRGSVSPNARSYHRKKVMP